MNNLPDDKNLRVLVIDDNRAIHDDFRKILSPAPAMEAAFDASEAAVFGQPTSTTGQTRFEISSAYQGGEGVRMVQSALEAGRPYAMAFVDVRMPPGLDGVETTRKIWELDPDLQIVLCTAYSDYSWTEMFEKLGQHDGLLILKKPFDAVEALQLANALTEKWRLHRESRRKMEELEVMVAERTSELQGKTAFLEAQVNSSIDGILVVDQQGRKTLQNQRLIDLLKIPPHIANDPSDEKQRRWVMGMVTNPGQFLEKSTYLQSNPNEVSRDELELKDGTILDRYSSPVVGEDGKYYGRIRTFRDITERKRAEEAMHRQKNELRVLFDLMPAMIWFKDTANGILRVNQQVADAAGKPVEEIEGKPSQEIYPQDAARFYADDLEVIRSGVPKLGYVQAMRGPKGQELWVQTDKVPFRDQQGNIVGIIVMAQDISERRRAEEALRESEERFVGAFELAPIGVSLVSPEGRFLKVNRALCHLLGYSEADLLARTFQDITHPEDLADDLENVRQLLAGEISTYQLEKRYVHARGHLVSVLLNVSLVRCRQGQPLYFISQIQDITERKRAEEELRRSQMFLRMAGRLVRMGAWSVEIPGLEQNWSDEVCAIYEVPVGTTLPVEETINRYTPESREIIQHAFEACLRDGTAYDVELQLTATSGKLVWVRAIGEAERNAAGLIHRVQGALQDITERMQAESLVRQSEERYRSLIENARDAIFTIAADGTFSSLNPAVETIAGLSRPDWLGKPFAPMVHPEDLPLALEMFQRILQGGQAPVHELRGHPSLKRPAIMEMTLAAQKDESGKIIGVLGIGRDITERKRIEDQLFQSQKMETVGKLAGGIAHEFNSILTAILGQSELLLADLPPQSPLSGNVIEISKAAGRAAVLTRQLLAYGRKQFLQPEALDLNRILAGMDGIFHHLMGGEVNTQIIPAADLHAVKADAGQIEQVIMNMVINARDAMPKGGKLTLETANVSVDVESVGRYAELKPGEYVMLAISDTGMGMNEEVKARVFEPFFSTKGVGEGTGLGLSTCYGIIKQSGGHISVYSEPGRGTTFKIYLPQVEKQTKTPIQRLTSPGLPPGTETILLVEDDPALREMAATLLGRLGYTVLKAANGLEALSLKQQRDTGHIDLLFTDVVMPHMNGKELADRVRALHPQTKILFTSAYTENAIVHQGMLNQGVALLQKPFTPSALANKLREVLDQPDAAAAKSLGS